MKKKQLKNHWILVLLCLFFFSGSAQIGNDTPVKRDSLTEEMMKIMLGQINIFGDYDKLGGWDSIPFFRGYENEDFLKYLSPEFLKGNKDAIDPNDMEIDGLVTDATRTKMGRDFYDLFYQKFVAPAGSKNFNIIVAERPYRATTTQVQIFVNDEVVFEQFLQPRYEVLESLAGMAVGAIQNFLYNYDRIMKELNGDDMDGSGIF